MTDQPYLEALAQALSADIWSNSVKDWPALEEDCKESWRAAARDYVVRLARAGYVIVPREPTDAMLDRGYAESYPLDNASAYATIDVIWHAMIDAPFLPDTDVCCPSAGAEDR